ncbi:MAG: ORC1-type replication protein [Thermoproteota archaeon]|nr:ORC1-type replication protein [Thermoproteota archaeon]
MNKLSKATVFKDDSLLSPRYVPKTLPHREKQIKFMFNIFKKVIDDPTRAFLRPVQVVGGIGTGKTCSTIRFGEELQAKAKEKKINLKHVYANLKLQGSSGPVLYRYLLDNAAPEVRTGNLSADEMLYHLVKYLNAKNMYLIISLDEIEYFMKHTKEHIIYDLTRINELTPNSPCRILGLVVISRGTDYYSLLDKSELSTLGRSMVDFRPYTSEQIRDILSSRAQEAFKSDTVPDSVIEFIADVTAAPPVNGDVRYALDLLLFAGNLADNQGSDTVELDYVRRMHGEVYHQITSEDILDLPYNEKLVLLAVARTLRSKKSAYVSFKEINDQCELVSEELNVKLGDVDYAVQDLDDRGIIDIRSLVRIGISDIPTEELIKYLDNLVERVRSDLNEGKS